MSAAISNEWYYAQAGQQMGPVPVEELQRRLTTGEVSRSDLAWTEGMAEWQPISSMPDLFPAATGVAPLAYAAPQVGVPMHPDYGAQVVYAGFWWRFLAAFIDGIIMAIAGAVIGGVAGGIIGLAMGPGRNMELAAGLAGQVIGIVLNWLYYAMMESGTTQGTLGKMACQIRVVDLNGNRISFARATGRFFGKYISGIILAIGYMMAGWTERKQALHDMMAGTLVLKTR